MARITLVTDEILGYTRTGGIGTATTFLALGLGRGGHDVEILYGADTPEAELEDEWARLYDAAGVRVRGLSRDPTPVEPAYFGRMRDVESALASDPPDVAIVQDLAAPAYTSIRLRTLGLGFEHTLFVVYCHGTRQWITDAARKVRVLPGALAITNLERASIELADVVISPSAYLVDWMREQQWNLPAETRVIPYVTRDVALGEARADVPTSNGRIQRVVFFGRLEERKGIEPFIAAVNALPANLLKGVDVEFLGRSTPAWQPARVRSLLRDDIDVSFSTDLDQSEALSRLRRPGTVAVMPSLLDNSPNTITECIQHGIPFLATTTGGVPELVAERDRARVLCPPTADDLARAFERVLQAEEGWAPAGSGFEPESALLGWREVVERQAAPPKPAASQTPHVDAAGTGSAPFVLLLGDDDEADDDLVATLARAQQVSDADVVTCAVRVRDTGTSHVFHGQPRALGLLGNAFGTVALVRRSLLKDVDPRWPSLARLSVSGARIVSVPRVLATQSSPPATLERFPAEALLVAQAFERALPSAARGLARLTAGLAAAAAQGARRDVAAPKRTRARARVHRALGAAIGIARKRAPLRRRHGPSS